MSLVSTINQYLESNHTCSTESKFSHQLNPLDLSPNRQQEPSSPRQTQWNTNNFYGTDNKGVMNSSNNNHSKKQPVPSPPPPFLSFRVENKNCAIYVGNIPMGGANRCEICSRVTDDFGTNEQGVALVDNSIGGDQQQESCDCETELKTFLRERINAAFKVPIKRIGIRTCRFFSVVTNVYSNSVDKTGNGDDVGENGHLTGSPNPNNSHRHSGRRLHRAACVEFEDPKIAEHALGLKYTNFGFQREPTQRSSLRFRRWTMEPPHSHNNQKKDDSRGKNPPSSPTSITIVGDRSVGSVADVECNSIGELSSTCQSATPLEMSPSMVHVGNIPPDATCEGIRAFFLGRMNKAFHWDVPPRIVRVGMRHRILPPSSNSTSSSNSVSSLSSDTSLGTHNTNRLHIDACVEFQDPKFAYCATILKNRRWHAESNNQLDGENETEDVVCDEREVLDGSSKAPLLEIKLWDPVKYDIGEFFPIGRIVDCSRDEYPRQTTQSDTFGVADKEGANSVYREDIVNEQTLHTTLTVNELKEKGFLLCTNPSKTPKCDHLFAIPGGNGEIKRARICHGHVFHGKVCRNHKRSLISTTNKKKDVSGGSFVCPFAHIDSFEELRDPQDILALLYYVHNNDEVEFVSGTGCTPSEYLEQMGNFFCKQTTPQPMRTTPIKSTDDTVRRLTNELNAVRRQLAKTQRELHRSETANKSLFRHQAQESQMQAKNAPGQHQTNENNMIRSLHYEVAHMKVMLEETNRNWKVSERAAMDWRNKYTTLDAKVQTSMNQGGNIPLSTEIYELEISKLKEELQHTQRSLQEYQKTTSSSIDSSLDRSYSSLPVGRFDNFLQRSVPTLMEMTKGNSRPARPSRRQRARADRGGPKNFTLKSEILSLQSIYSNQVQVQYDPLYTTITRYLMLPTGNPSQGNITVTLILTVPLSYPAEGVVGVDAEAHVSTVPWKNGKHHKIDMESLPGLLNVCRWEAEACAGSLALMRIIKTAERWVTNDWSNVRIQTWGSEFRPGG